MLVYYSLNITLAAEQENIVYLYEINKATVLPTNPLSAKLNLNKTKPKQNQNKQTKTNQENGCRLSYSHDAPRSELASRRPPCDSYSYTGQ